MFEKYRGQRTIDPQDRQFVEDMSVIEYFSKDGDSKASLTAKGYLAYDSARRYRNSLNSKIIQSDSIHS